MRNDGDDFKLNDWIVHKIPHISKKNNNYSKIVWNSVQQRDTFVSSRFSASLALHLMFMPHGCKYTMGAGKGNCLMSSGSIMEISMGSIKNCCINN